MLLFLQQKYFDSKIGANDKRLSKNPSVLLGTTLLSNQKFKPEYIAQQVGFPSFAFLLVF